MEEALEQETKMRDAKWAESIAVGSKEFVEETKEELGALFETRKMEGKDGLYQLHERQAPYGRLLHGIEPQEAMNTYQWQ